MKQFWILFLGVVLIGFSACTEEDMSEYSIMIMQPNTDAKSIGDNMHLHINFDDANDNTVHHINVRIYNKADESEVYNKPNTAHVHEESGHYEWHDDFELSTGNGIEAGTDYVLEAKVWGHEAGMAEVTQTVEFRVE